MVIDDVKSEAEQAAQRKRVLSDAVELVEIALDCTRVLDPHLLEMAEHALAITAGRLGALKLLAKARAAALELAQTTS